MTSLAIPKLEACTQQPRESSFKMSTTSIGPSSSDSLLTRSCRPLVSLEPSFFHHMQKSYHYTLSRLLFSLFFSRQRPKRRLLAVPGHSLARAPHFPLQLIAFSAGCRRVVIVVGRGRKEMSASCFRVKSGRFSALLLRRRRFFLLSSRLAPQGGGRERVKRWNS